MLSVSSVQEAHNLPCHSSMVMVRNLVPIFEVNLVPIFEVEYPRGMWWALPAETSRQLYSKYECGEQDIGYAWDWGNTFKGTFHHDGEKTSISRYVLNFDTMEQTNIDTQYKRFFRIVWLRKEDADRQPVEDALYR